jgi:hypothetical protein
MKSKTKEKVCCRAHSITLCGLVGVSNHLYYCCDKCPTKPKPKNKIEKIRPPEVELTTMDIYFKLGAKLNEIIDNLNAK